MVNESVRDQVCQIAADIFSVSQAEITLQSSPDTVKNWDSVQHMLLVLALEEHFDQQFEPEEVTDMLSIELIISLIEEKVKIE